MSLPARICDVPTRILLIKVKMYKIIQILDKIVLVELSRDA